MTGYISDDEDSEVLSDGVDANGNCQAQDCTEDGSYYDSNGNLVNGTEVSTSATANATVDNGASILGMGLGFILVLVSLSI